MRILALIIFVTIFFTGCGEIETERVGKSMGSAITLKAIGAESQAAVEESLEKIAALEKNILADTKKIEAAAGNGDFVEIDAEVYKILAVAQKYSALTDGAFDVTIGAAVDLWKAKKIPAAAEIASAQNLVNYKNLELGENNRARLKIAGMKINLGGVAKGYAVDVAREIFAKHKISDGLIDFGTSSIYALGEKNIGLKNPRGENLAEIVTLKNAAISTSGDYEKFFIVDGRRYSHILNPRTCAPVETNIAAASVIVDGRVENCGTVADILSTAVFILGKERAEKILSEAGFPEPVKIAVFVDG